MFPGRDSYGVKYVEDGAPELLPGLRSATK